MRSWHSFSWQRRTRTPSTVWSRSSAAPRVASASLPPACCTCLPSAIRSASCPCVPALIEALDRPEAQTRWEALDALTALATTCPEQLGDAFEGAETALFDEISSTLRYAAFRLLCVWGATGVERSREAWPILDEAIQCYHGDLEYRDMLGCLYEFGQGEIDAEVAEKLALRLKFDAENGKGSYLKARSSEICEMLVKRFGLDLSKKKKRASVKKSDDAENEE